jgi:hypothetical protein
MTDFTIEQIHQIDSDLLDALNVVAQRHALTTQDLTVRLISVLALWVLTNAPMLSTPDMQLAHLQNIQKTIFLNYARQMRPDGLIM